MTINKRTLSNTVEKLEQAKNLVEDLIRWNKMKCSKLNEKELKSEYKSYRAGKIIFRKQPLTFGDFKKAICSAEPKVLEEELLQLPKYEK